MECRNGALVITAQRERAKPLPKCEVLGGGWWFGWVGARGSTIFIRPNLVSGKLQLLLVKKHLGS